MREVVGLYRKTFYFWWVDPGDPLPLGMPELMMSFTKDEQVRDNLNLDIPFHVFAQVLPNILQGMTSWLTDNFTGSLGQVER
jgi:hypothetical protein